MQDRCDKFRTQGFTLLELLLAISILAVISAAAYQLLTISSAAISSVTQAKKRVLIAKNLQWRIRQDIHGITRPLHTFEDSSAIIEISPLGEHLMLIRDKYTKSSLQYSAESIFYRLSQPSSQRAATATQKSLTRQKRDENSQFYGYDPLEIYQNIDKCKIEVIDLYGGTHLQWPIVDLTITRKDNNIAKASVPSLIVLSFDTELLGEFKVVVNAW